MGKFIDTAKAVAKAGMRHHYRQIHLRAARNALRGLEAKSGPFSQKDRKLCDAYAVDVLGHKRFAEWLYIYAYVAGEFREGWIPDNFYDECVLQHTSAAYGEVSCLRALNTVLFDGDEFSDVAASVNGLILDRHGRQIPDALLADTLFADGDRVVFKCDDSQSGTGTTVLDRAAFDPGKLRTMGSGVVQSFIRQHPIFPHLSNSASVATIRLTTAADDNGKVGLRSAFVRFGRAGDRHVVSASEIRLAIDLVSGALSDTGYMPDWSRIDRHPDADEPFAGHSIPNFGDCVRAVIRCHERLRLVRCIGWDLVVDADGKVKIMEWNGGHNGIKFCEAVEGPCFADLNWQRFRL